MNIMALKVYIQSTDVQALDKFIKELTTQYAPSHIEVMKSSPTAKGTEHNRLLIWDKNIDNKMVKKLQNFPTPKVVKILIFGLDDD